MKKAVKRILTFCLCLAMLLSGVMAAPADKAESGTYADQWEYKVDETSGVAYYALDVVYCEKPVLPEVQHLVIYAPAAYMTQNEDGTVVLNKDGKVISSTGAVYTAENAPLLLHNTSGGYSSSTIQPVDVTYLNEGYIHVSIATRGKETKSVVNEYTGTYDRDAMEATKDAEGEYIGQFPALIVDMKAGIRFLKYFDAELPGNSQRIVSRGYSSGGAVSAMLGASGNSHIFDSYLEEIGAYDATDDIFVTLASAPITNLSSADASYEWYQYANEKYFLFNAMAFDRLGNKLENFPVGPKNKYTLGSNVLGGAHEDELSALLYDWYVDYVQNMGFDLGDDGRSGQFYDGFAEIYADALEEYIVRYDELKTEKQPATVEEYLTSLGEGWFTYDAATGEVTVSSLDALVQNHIARKKMCPSLDAYNYKSNENDAFTAADGTTLHFSPTVRDALKTLMDDADGVYNWSEEELQYITDLYNDYAAGVTEEAAEMLEVMSPINYIVGTEGYTGATVSPYWRLRVGSEDGDHGAPAGWLIAQGLEKYHPEVEVSMGIAWGMGHSLSELTEQDLYDYIAEIMIAEDQISVIKNHADQWEYVVDEASGVGYYKLTAVYCENPVDPELQQIAIYAPAAYMTENEDGTVVLNKDGKVVSSTGAVYTAENAPVLLHNHSGGYTSSTIKGVDVTYLQEGYVHVELQTRGKETQDAEGNYIGQFPLLIVDMKAGIRFLKYFDAELPGNSERIVSRGFSSGGAVSAMLGATGNSPIFDSYLEEIGAYDATDDIFITLASAPITNLDSADASYEWYQNANPKYFLFNSMAFDRLGNQLENFPVGPKNKYTLGSNVLGGAHEDELSALLYDWYVDYVQGLGFDLGDDGRSGEFYDGFAEIYADALEEYIVRYDELKTEKSPATVEEYLTSLGEGWFTYDAATGEVTIPSLDALVQNHIQRKKMCPSLDSYNYKSNENDAFKAADGTTVHFSPTVRDALKTLMDDAATYGWTAEELQYITDLYNDYAAGVTDESAEMLEVMSPINYVVNKEGYEADMSPYWRIRIGSEDGDHGAPAGWLIAQGLEKYHPEVEVSMGIAWGMGHSLSELTEQDLYDYIAEIMIAEDQISVEKPEAPSEPETPAEPEVPAEPAVKTYAVKSGDSLWRIAAKQLGSGLKWNELYEANKGIVKDPNLIYVGQILTLP